MKENKHKSLDELKSKIEKMKDSPTKEKILKDIQRKTKNIVTK